LEEYLLRAKQELAQEKGLAGVAINMVCEVYTWRTIRTKENEAQTETIREKSFVLLMFRI
jgi:hypothetical protein